MIRIDFDRLRFLVIDDNAHMRRILRTLLHGFGTREVYEAEDGAAGLEAFTHYMPDIVITDIYMPVMNGLEMVEQLRREGFDGEFVILSGYADFEYARKAMRLNIVDYLSKPATVQTITEVLERVISQVEEKLYQQMEQKQLQEKLML
jgi:YesN/AraC family two-component response regulator